MRTVLLIGLGRFGMHMARQFHQRGHQILAVDHREERVNEVLPFVTSAQIGDSASLRFLSSLGPRDFDVCVVAIGGDFQSSLETTAHLKQLGAPLVVSRAENDSQAGFLLRNGADEILYPEKQLAKWAAIRYGSEHVLDYIELDESHAILEVSVPKGWLGRSVGQLQPRQRYGLNILACKKDGALDAAITPETVLAKDMTLMVLGPYRALQKCFHI